MRTLPDILGLPGETDEDMFNKVRYVAKSDVQGVKLQLLHVIRDTDMAIDYENGLFHTLTMEHYGA